MAPYHIRKYQENDHKWVLELFSSGILERIPDTFHHVLRLPRTLVLLLAVPLSLLLASGSWLLAITSCATLLVLLRQLARYPWNNEMDTFLRTDMADITKTYFSVRGSCFWVAEAGEQVVGTVSALPVKDAPLGKKQAQLFHLSVNTRHRGMGIGKALVRTLLQFAREQGYHEVVIETTILHRSALALYQRMGFQRTGQYFPSTIWRILAVPVIRLTCLLPSAQEGSL
ncbi:putative N-acetyltransferase CML1 [Ctenodactylus gundi]